MITTLTRPRQVPRVGAFLGLLTVLGCGGDNARGGDEARVFVRYYQVPTLPRNMLTVVLSEARGSRTLRGADIGGQTPEVREFPTGLSGTLRVAFRFAQGISTASEGSLDVTLQPDWIYGFDIFVDSLNPTRSCFGCQGSRAFPLAPEYRRSPRDSVWLVWGGNSIKNPAVY